MTCPKHAVAGTYSSSYFMDTGIHQGIEIGRFQKERERDKIAASWTATNGRLKIFTHTWPGNPPQEGENDINLVVGRLSRKFRTIPQPAPRSNKNSRSFLFTAGGLHADPVQRCRVNSASTAANA